MTHEELIERLRNPRKFRRQVAEQNDPKAAGQAVRSSSTKSSRIPALVGGGVFFLVLLSLLFIFASQDKADHINRALDPAVLKGLVADRVFSPKTGKTYIQVSEGAERNVNTALESGSTLPVISRYNYRSLTDGQYQVIGAAPWALSINVTANIEDPDLLRYLFNQQNMIDAFLEREKVAALIEDPEALARIAADEQGLKTFFEQEAVQQALASAKVVEALAGSRLFAHLLISKAVKHYRKNPEQAVRLIHASPTLSALQKNPAIQKAVKENTYLKNISATLLQ